MGLSVEQILVLAGMIYSFALHEVGHAVAAAACGDPTARKLGRITLNPLPSIDPVGSILVPVVASFSGFVLGWAKPVPVVPANFRHRVFGDVVVSMAGVFVNLTLAFALLVAWVALDKSHESTRFVLWNIARWNVLLALFNMIPVPPLDGSHVFQYALPPAWRAPFRRLGFMGFVVIVAIWFIPPVKTAFLGAFKTLVNVWLDGAEFVVSLFG